MHARIWSHTHLRIVSTTTLYRPVGPEELALIQASGWKAFPPRLPEQSIFYPVRQPSLRSSQNVGGATVRSEQACPFRFGRPCDLVLRIADSMHFP
jgi:hypothetical protein